MRNMVLYFVLLTGMLFASCRNDESYKAEQPSGPATLSLQLTSRVGSVVGDSLTQYIKSMNLLLFRQNEAGNYFLYRQKVLDKEQLDALSDTDETVDPGFTVFKEITFDTIPLGNYQMVGIGNALDSLGNLLPNVSLEGNIAGNSMQQVLVKIADGDLSSRLFLGTTGLIQAGGNAASLPVLRLYRKVAMFSLTLQSIPDVVDRIDMQFEHTYGEFDAAGTYNPASEITVYSFTEYKQTVSDNIVLNYVMLPTVEGDSTSILATFRLSGGNKQNVTLPEYFFRPNTITKVTATIDTDQSGNVWKVDISSLISVNVEWNVDQEPPITI